MVGEEKRKVTNNHLLVTPFLLFTLSVLPDVTEPKVEIMALNEPKCHIPTMHGAEALRDKKHRKMCESPMFCI